MIKIFILYDHQSHPHGGIGGGMQRTHMPSAASAPPPQVLCVIPNNPLNIGIFD